MEQRTLTLVGAQIQTITVEQGCTVMEALSRYGDGQYSFPCGGNGLCGKCAMKVLKGEFAVTAEDETFFSKEQLQEGYRLACKAVIEGDCEITYRGAMEEEFEVLGGYYPVQEGATAESDVNKAGIVDELTLEGIQNENAGQDYGIAIDIGTTTIAVSLLENATKEPVVVHTSLNRQRRYGADVIARIQASNEGKGKELRQSIQEDLLSGIEAVLQKADMDGSRVSEIVIAGNTTMGHLLLGYSCETLGVYPFTPVDISGKTLSFVEVFDTEQYDIPIYFVPGISTFVGADLTAGLLHCGFHKKEEVCMLIDLGTNGEMAIGNKDKLLVTSTAAGPAFEGGNISCGIGSIDGAICDVALDGEQAEVKTIGNQPMTGICGTGVIAMTAELCREELLDEAGLLDEDYFDDGYMLGETEDGEVITFTQKDVREIQLAKSAVRSGIETLILQYGIEREQIHKIYLAGGFGYKMNLEKAASIGLLPEDMLPRIEAVGNSSLGGAALTVGSKVVKAQLQQMSQIAEEVSLSEDKNFQEFYMEYMMFGEE